MIFDTNAQERVRVFTPHGNLALPNTDYVAIPKKIGIVNGIIFTVNENFATTSKVNVKVIENNKLTFERTISPIDEIIVIPFESVYLQRAYLSFARMIYGKEEVKLLVERQDAYEKLERSDEIGFELRRELDDI